MAKSEGKSGIVQFVKFAVVGVSNTAVDWVVFKVLVITILSDSDTYAKAISFIISVVNSYIWNTIWTFNKEYRKTVGKSGAASKASVAVKFVVVSLVGLGINVLVYNYVSKNVSYRILDKDLIPLFFASGSAIVWNFFANKFWTYKK